MHKGLVSNSRSYKWGLGVAVILVLALVIGLSLGIGKRRPNQSAAKALLAQRREPAPHEDNSMYGTTRVPSDEPHDWHSGDGKVPSPNRPIITSARVEKTEVCRGEQDFLDVDATTANGTDAFLTVTLWHPQTNKVLRGGSRIPFVLDGSASGELKIVVEGRNSSNTITLPAVKVKDCDAARQVHISHTRSADALERIFLKAELKLAGAELAAGGESTPVAYEWDFGDGTKQTTTEPATQHSYEDRDQSVAQSSFVVTVKIKSTHHEDEGALLLSFPNLGFVSLVYENKIVLSVGVAPPGGKGEPEKIWLYHGYSKGVRLTKAVLREVIIDSDNQAERETFRREYAPEVLLGFADIPAKESRVAHDLSGVQPSDPGAIRYISVTGVSADGKTVVGSFSLLPEKH